MLGLVAGALVLAGCSDSKAGRKEGAINKAGKISVFDVQIGDCLMPGDELGTEITDVHAVPCKDPHTHEVFALPEYDEDDVYPGDEKLRNFADAECISGFNSYTGTEYLESDLFFSYLQPSIRSWNEGDDRRIVCVIVATGDPVEGSARKASAQPGGQGTPNPADDKSKTQRQVESKVESEIQGRLRDAVGR